MPGRTVTRHSGFSDGIGYRELALFPFQNGDVCLGPRLQRAELFGLPEDLCRSECGEPDHLLQRHAEKEESVHVGQEIQPQFRGPAVGKIRADRVWRKALIQEPFPHLEAEVGEAVGRVEVDASAAGLHHLRQELAIR